MEPEESVTALKIRERVRNSKKEGEEDRSWKDRGVELKFREKGGNMFLRNTNVPNGKRNVAYGNSKNQGPSALGTKPFSIRNKNVFQNSRNFGTKPN